MPPKAILALAALALLVIGAAASAQPATTRTFRMEAIPGLAVETDQTGYFDLLPNTSRTLVVELRNEGNETLALRVTAMESRMSQDQPERVRAVLERSELTLEPSESARLELNVTASDAPENTTTQLMLQFNRENTSQMRMHQVPILLGPPCPECKPPANQGGGIFYSGPAGGGPGGADGHVETVGPGGSGPSARTETRPIDREPALDESDPYQEVPGPGALAALAGGLGALALRARRKLPVALLALAILAPGAVAQSSLEQRSFLVGAISRTDDDVTLDVKMLREGPSRVILGLYADGRLLAPEQVYEAWWAGHTKAITFRDINASQVELRIEFTTNEADRPVRQERTPLSLPPIARASIDATRAVLDDRLRLALTLVNTGGADSGRIVARLESSSGTRIGDPLAQSVPGIAADGTAEVTFQLRAPLDTVTLVLEHDNQTRRITLEVDRAGGGVRLGLSSATLTSDGLATFHLVNLGETAVHNALAYLETGQGIRVGAPSSLRIGSLEPDGVSSLSFTLEKDLANVTLVVEAAGERRTFAVRLDERGRSGGSDADVTLKTDLPSREATPGDAASYALTIENKGDDALLSLRAEGLPDGYDVSFTIDNSVVRTLVLDEDSTRKLSASVRIPAGASRDAGRTLPFSIVALDEDGDVAARIELALTVRGAPRLELAGQNWFANVAAGESQTVALAVRNTGTATVRDVRLTATTPSQWSAAFSPSSIARIEPGESVEVQLTLTAPADAAAGRYTLDVAAATADIAARPRSFVVEVDAESTSKLPWAIGAGLAGLAATALIVKFRRR